MSVVSEERHNWLNEVKSDAEAITKSRLEHELPQVEREVSARQVKKTGNTAQKNAAQENPVPTQPVPGESDGQPDQGAIEEPKSGSKKVSN